MPRITSAQSYPTRPVRLIEGFGAGSAPDIVARLIGQSLSDRLGQSSVIENRAGASSNIATEAVVRASPDGYTLLLITTANAINATMFKLNFDFVRDIAPVASIVRVPYVMEVHPSVTAKTVAEFIAYAKAHPGKINLASAGIGSGTHVAGEMFKTMAGVDLFHVPYRGTQVFPALLAGEAQVYFGPLLSSIGYVRAGNLRALAVTTTTRSPVLPDIPALSETLPGYEASAWFGMGAPKNTPVEIIKRLNTQVNASLADANFQARLASLGGMVLAGSPADFRALRPKPELVVHAGDLPATAEAVRDLLADSGKFFDRGVPVRLDRQADGSPPKAIALTKNTVVIETHRLVQPVKFVRGTKVEVTLPDRVAQMYLDMGGEYGLPPLAGISTAPVLSRDGAMRVHDGYDWATALWCCCSLSPLTIPSRPTEIDAAVALHRLRRAFRTFPFADAPRRRDASLGVEVVHLAEPPGRDESSFLVALLTATCRPSLWLVGPTKTFTGDSR
jgi:tripartite-type tricarboxylate transporter receptor subunit TctC